MLEKDQKTFIERMQKSPDGEILNPVKINGLPENASIKQIGTKLNELSETARTHGLYAEIGSMYGFKLLVKTEVSKKDGFDFKENQFFVEGESGIKYTYNNGIMASDINLASKNFLNALLKIPTLIDNEHKRITKAEKEMAVFQEMVNTALKSTCFSKYSGYLSFSKSIFFTILPKEPFPFESIRYDVLYSSPSKLINKLNLFSCK